MKEYIERKEAIRMIRDDLPNVVNYHRMDAIECLELMPAADVVEVVRCKNCKYCHREIRWNGEERFECFRESQFDMETTYPDDYCSYGERKTD